MESPCGHVEAWHCATCSITSSGPVFHCEECRRIDDKNYEKAFGAAYKDSAIIAPTKLS